jgi:hypothetical protein
MRKVKCFVCHRFGHYAGQCLNRNKGGKETQPEISMLAKNQMDDFCKKFE